MNDAPTIYGSSNIASRIAGELAEASAIEDISDLSMGSDRAALLVVMDNGQRFKITVEQDDHI